MAALILIRFITLAAVTPILTTNRFREEHKLQDCELQN